MLRWTWRAYLAIAMLAGGAVVFVRDPDALLLYDAREELALRRACAQVHSADEVTRVVPLALAASAEPAGPG